MVVTGRASYLRRGIAQRQRQGVGIGGGLWTKSYVNCSDLASNSLAPVCALAVGGLIGLNRSEHGRAAGLRTGSLVCLAACVAMLQVNLLLSVAGRPPDSFVMNDLMRLPLGILSGMGFIGAGTIVRRQNFVVGVTRVQGLVLRLRLWRRRPTGMDRVLQCRASSSDPAMPAFVRRLRATEGVTRLRWTPQVR